MPELSWNGKFRTNGQKAAPPRIALPFQTVETVNESAQERQRMLDLFTAEHPTEWRNRLVWGDKKYVLPSLVAELAGQVDLIYIDPPFATGADFSFMTSVPGSSESFTKEPSIIEQKAYRDTWGRGLDGLAEAGQPAVWAIERQFDVRCQAHQTVSKLQLTPRASLGAMQDLQTDLIFVLEGLVLEGWSQQQ